MNILLFNPKFDPKVLTYQRMSGLPLGLLSIATYLNRNGHHASVVDRSFRFESFDALHEQYAPDVVGISLISNMTILDMLKIASFFKGKGVPVVVGGTLGSVIPEVLLKEADVDYIAIGEGEQIWLNFANALEAGSDVRLVHGLAYYENGKTVFTPPQEFMDLSLLGPSDFSLLPNIPHYFQTSYCYKNMVYLYMSKGCTGSCSFCYNTFFHQSCRRTRPIAHMLDEVQYLMENHGLETVYFADELWGLQKRERQELFAQMKERGLSFIWGCQTRIGVLNKEDIREMFDNGCRWIMFGIEAPPGHLAEIANKKLPYNRVQETLENCREIGMITNISFILNYPHETEQDLYDTVAFAQSLTPTLYTIHLFTPNVKSALYNQVVREGLFEPLDTIEKVRRDGFSEVVYKFSDVRARDYKVIRACFMVQDLFADLPQQSEKQHITGEAIKAVLLNIRSQNPLDWLKGTFYTGKYFLGMVAYAFLFPRVRRKYNFRFRFRR